MKQTPNTDLHEGEKTVLKLGPVETKVFSAWRNADPDWAYPFAAVSERSGVPLRQIRRAVRSLARKGLVVYLRGLFTDEGYTAGSGYALTEAGHAFDRAITASEAGHAE